MGLRSNESGPNRRNRSPGRGDRTGTLKHVDELTEELRARGRPILYEDDHPYAGGENHYAVYFECPERIKVEVVAPE